jgi:hypothetical protein
LVEQALHAVERQRFVSPEAHPLSPTHLRKALRRFWPSCSTCQRRSMSSSNALASSWSWRAARASSS